MGRAEPVGDLDLRPAVTVTADANLLHEELRELAAGYLFELRLAARQVAKLIRGGIVRTGRRTEELEPRQQAAVQYITSAQRVGVPEPEIDQTLLARGFGKNQISWLKKFRIDYPGQ